MDRKALADIKYDSHDSTADRSVTHVGKIYCHLCREVQQLVARLSRFSFLIPVIIALPPAAFSPAIRPCLLAVAPKGRRKNNRPVA